MFLTSDGISDNFDPVVIHIDQKSQNCQSEYEHLGWKVLCAEETGSTGLRCKRSSNSWQGTSEVILTQSVAFFEVFKNAFYLRPGPELDFLPTVEAFQRHELTLLRMEDILNTGSGSKPSGLESAGLESNGQGRWDKLCKI